MNATVPRPTFRRVERRKHRRFPDPDLTLTIDGREASVLDLSVGGVRAAAATLPVGRSVSMALTSRIDAEPRSIQALGRVVASAGGQASIAFSAPTYALMHFIVHFLADRHGVEPHLFR